MEGATLPGEVTTRSVLPADGGATNVGRSAPLGATASPEGVNFSLYSRDASGIELVFFNREDDLRPGRVIPLNRTYHYWHVFVPGVPAGQLYGYRVYGPVDPSKGLRFYPTQGLLDPYGRRGS